MVRHSQNMTEDWRQDNEDAVDTLLAQETARGVFASKNPALAYYVDGDVKGVGINNALVQESESYNVVVAPATARPGRFISIWVTRDDRGIRSAIAKLKGGGAA